MPSSAVPTPTPRRVPARRRVAVALTLAAGSVAGLAAPIAVAQPTPAQESVLVVPRDYPPPPSWSTRKGVCAPVSLGAGRTRHGLPPTDHNRMTSIRVVAKRRVPCSKASALARRYFVKGTTSGYRWRSTKAWGQDDGQGAEEYQGTRRGGRRVVFLASK